VARERMLTWVLDPSRQKEKQNRTGMSEDRRRRQFSISFPHILPAFDNTNIHSYFGVFSWHWSKQISDISCGKPSIYRNQRQ
jgi:hypothetical protein